MPRRYRGSESGDVNWRSLPYMELMLILLAHLLS
jgi:hypothetical protein